MKFDFSRNPYFGYRGNAFVALFGSLAPLIGKIKNHPGHRVVRVNMATSEYHDFLTSPHHDDHAPIRPDLLM